MCCLLMIHAVYLYQCIQCIRYIQSGLASLLDICYDSSAKHELLKSSEIDCDAFNFQKV